MKKLGSAVLSCSVFMFMALFLQAQSVPTIIAPTETVEPYSIYRADVKVANFKNIVGAQFTVEWDSTKLKFLETKNFIFEESALTEAFGKNQVSKGRLAFIWVDSKLEGKTLNDSTTLFSINFDVIGAPNTSSPVQFTDDVAAREIADTSREAIQAAYHNGMISIDAATGVTNYNSAPDKIQVENSYPNPFHDNTQIRFELQKPAKVRLVIRNVQGQKIYEERRYFANGANTLMLTKEMFPSAGTYQFSIIGPDFTVTQKLIHL